MNQTFKQKAIAVSLASVFALGAVAVQANTFSDSTAALAISAGVNVAAGSAVSVSSQTVTLTEVGTSISADGTVVFGLDNNAKFAGATVAPTNIKVTASSLSIANGTPSASAADSFNEVAYFKLNDKYYSVMLMSDATGALAATNDYVTAGAGADLAAARANAKNIGAVTVTAPSATGAQNHSLVFQSAADGLFYAVKLTATGASFSGAALTYSASGSTTAAAAVAAATTAPSGSIATAVNTALGLATQAGTAQAIATLIGGTAAGSAVTGVWGSSATNGISATHSAAGTTLTLAGLSGVPKLDAAAGAFTGFAIVNTALAAPTTVAGTVGRIVSSGSDQDTLATDVAAALNAVTGATVATAAASGGVSSKVHIAANSTGGTVTQVPGVLAVGTGVTTTTVSATDKTYIDTNGKLRVETNTNTTADTLSISGIKLDTSNSTVGSPVNLSLDTALTTVPTWAFQVGGVSATNLKIANVSSTSATFGTAPTALNTVAGVTAAGGGATGQLPTFSFSEGLPASVGTAAGSIVVTLKNGYSWAAAANAPTIAVTGGGTPTFAAPSLVVGSGNTVASYPAISGATSGTPGTFTFTPGDVFIPAGSTLPVVMNVVVKSSTGATLLTQDVTLANIVAKGVTSSFVESTGVATPTYDTLYTGRVYTSAAVTDSLRIKETAAATLTAGSTLTVGLSNGATFASNTSGDVLSSTTSVFPIGATTVDGFGFNSSFTVSASDKTKAPLVITDGTGANGSAGDLTLKIDQLSTVGATPGDLTVTFTSNAGGSAPALKYAEIKDASSASVSGTIPTAIPGGASFALPDVVITESKYGALEASRLSLKLPTGVTFVATTAPTVTVKDSSGNTLSSKVTTPDVSHFVSSGAYYNLEIATKSTSSTGPYTITVSGLKAIAASSATAGDVSVALFGTNVAVTGTPSADDAGKDGSNVGAKPTKATLKIASTVSSVNPTYPTATVADQTKLTLTNLPLVAAGNDQGKQGAVYVALIFQGNVFFQGADGSWTAYTGGSNVPAYFTGTLGTTNLNIVPTALDVSGAKGALFVTGYGLGIAGLGNPFDDFIKNARYNVLYTVK